jgi:hypothetical protein
LREIASASAAHRDAVGAAADAGVSRDIDRLMANEEALRSRADAAVASTRAGGLSLRRIGGRIAWISPWEGVLQESRCGPGPVAADVACFVLTRDQAQVRVDVPQRHLGRLTDEATGAFVDATGAVHEGLAVARRAPDIATETRTMSWWFSIPDPGHIGATGRAELRVPPPPGAMEVPVSAVTPLGGQDHVFLRTGPTPVEVLGRDADRVVVRALPDGAEVAVRGVLRLKAKALLAEEEEG